MTDQELVELAFTMLERSYVPYSKFPVGAALECADGTVFTGCNIENAAFSPTCCAERVAVFKAVSQGVREFAALAVFGRPLEGEARNFTAPCGVCSQVLQEFCSPEFPVIMAKNETEYRTVPLGELLPHGFGGDFFK